MYSLKDWQVLIEEDPTLIIEAPEHIKNNPDIIDIIIYSDKPELFKYASDNIKNNEEIADDAISQYPENLFEVNPKFFKYSKILFTALSVKLNIYKQILKHIDLQNIQNKIFKSVTLKINDNILANDLTDILREYSITKSDDIERTRVLVIEKDDDKMYFLKKVFKKNSGKIFKIYTVEMFLASLFSGEDIYKFDKKYLNSCVQNSIAFDQIFEMSFTWPNTELGEPADIEYNPSEKSLLKIYGYSVGKDSTLTTEERRKILTKVYNIKAPKEFEFWGQPKSSKRLYRMAKTISDSIKKSKGKIRNGNYSMQTAISDWENDLNWLKKTYYDNSHYWEFDEIW